MIDTSIEKHHGFDLRPKQIMRMVRLKQGSTTIMGTLVANAVPRFMSVQ